MKQEKALCHVHELRDRIAVLEEHLTYAIDALEGNPWTAWSTDDARFVLGRPKARRAFPQRFTET